MIRSQHRAPSPPEHSAPAGAESSYAWARLAIALVLSTIGGAGMWSVQVALPVVQSDFAITRADASLAYTLAMIGFGAGGVVLGRLADRHGVVLPIIGGATAVGLGFVAAGLSANSWQFALAYGALIGVGTSATFGPLMSDISLWFTRRRGIAVTIAASGNYVAGALWPPVVQHFIETAGWRATHIGIGLFCAATMIPLALLLRRRAPAQELDRGSSPAMVERRVASLNVSPMALQTILMIAGVACCVAMAMPQVHIVAYCGDLGYGAARGAEMLSLMLACGIISRVASGFIADRIGGAATLLVGSLLQGVALVLYLMFDGLASLYVISALFGLFQGGIVPMYAIIIREHFPARESGVRLGLVLMATLIGMALGGFISGLIFDLTGAYSLAFIHGIGWNLVNVAIALWLALGSTTRHPQPARQAG